MEDINKAVAVLGTLILAHRRRIKAYFSLCEMTSHEEIRSFCERHINHSQQIVNNLSKWRSAYGGFAKTLDKPAATDIWHQLRLILSLNAEKTVISRCEQLERETLKMYQVAMPLIPSSAAGDLQLHVKTLEMMVRTLQDFGERKQMRNLLNPS